MTHAEEVNAALMDFLGAGKASGKNDKAKTAKAAASR